MTEQQSIKVYTRRLSGKKNLAMFYRCPVTGDQHLKSTGTSIKRDAERAAALWQEQLNNASYHAPQRMSWDDFVDLYADSHLSTLRPKSADIALTGLRQFHRIVKPARIASVKATQIRKFKTDAKKEEMKTNTINTYLRCIRAALNWAVSEEIISSAPQVRMLKADNGGKRMKGKPLTDEQIQQFIDAAPLVRKHDAERWQRFIRGLVLSGLRLGEALRLSWDEESDFCLDFSGLYPCFRIHGSAQKNGKSQTLPLHPDFERFLFQTPKEQRKGLVFDLSGEQTATGRNLSDKRCSRIVSSIAEAGGVVVDPHTGQTATCHDLRRTYGQRLALSGVSPYELKELMRHADIKTSMAYYIDLSHEDIAANLHRRFAAQDAPVGDTFGDTCPSDVSADKIEPHVFSRNSSGGQGTRTPNPLRGT